MKIITNLYGLVYKNHNGAYTRKPYQGFLYTSLDSARRDALAFSPETKKNLKPARITLTTIE